MDRRIKVLIVEEARAERSLLARILGGDPLVEVVGVAAGAIPVLRCLAQRAPGLVLIDVDLGESECLEITRRIMETQPVPIVICGSAAKGAISAMRFAQAGVVACVEKPVFAAHRDVEAQAMQLRQAVKVMSEVKVVRHWPRLETGVKPSRPTPAAPPKGLSRVIDLIGIGASTGGPPVVQTILAGLPKEFPVPVLIVQHMAPGFLEGMAEWLRQTTGFKVQIAAYGIQPLPGHAYLAPDDHHLAVDTHGRLVLAKGERNHDPRPSVAHLFRSLAGVCGAWGVGVLLTGMGNDGALELKLMKDLGAVTIVQDRDPAVIYGMPGEAIALGAATSIFPAHRIASELVSLL
jgi:two-component system chemotaxis response regulator CheB